MVICYCRNQVFANINFANISRIARELFESPNLGIIGLYRTGTIPYRTVRKTAFINLRHGTVRYVTIPWCTIRCGIGAILYGTVMVSYGARCCSTSSLRPGPHEAPTINIINRWAVAQTCITRCVHACARGSAYEHDALIAARPHPNQLQRIETKPSGQIAKLLVCKYI